jgi:glycosyltransferase involved in cell wall biosynthesis
MPLVSISHSQRAPIRDANFAGTVYHGLPLDLLMPTLEPLGDYLAFLGRISPEKGVDRAIAIARAVNLPLKIAAKIDRADENYYRTEIAPKLEPGRVEYIGEIGDLAKAKFLGAASALLFPIDWPEPFGLVMIEAMACGTPVLAFDAGAVREIIDEGITGKVVNPRNFERACHASPCRGLFHVAVHCSQPHRDRPGPRQTSSLVRRSLNSCVRHWNLARDFNWRE